MGDVLAVADAEGIDRFAIWGLSYGGWIAWLTVLEVPERIPAIITTGACDPRASTEEEALAEFDAGWGAALRQDGVEGLIEAFREEDGDDMSREFPPWAVAATLRQDSLALLAIQSHELAGERPATLEDFSVPALLISGEYEDEDHAAAETASMTPDAESLWLRGLGHGGACQASALMSRWSRLRASM